MPVMFSGTVTVIVVTSPTTLLVTSMVIGVSYFGMCTNLVDVKFNPLLSVYITVAL